MIGIVLMDLLAAGVLRLTEWGLGLTGPATEVAAIFGRSRGARFARFRRGAPFWLGVVNLVAHAWAYSFFWTAAALIYLWLRHDVDGTPWEDIDPPGVPSLRPDHRRYFRRSRARAPLVSPVSSE